MTPSAGPVMLSGHTRAEHDEGNRKVEHASRLVEAAVTLWSKLAEYATAGS